MTRLTQPFIEALIRCVRFFIGKDRTGITGSGESRCITPEYRAPSGPCIPNTATQFRKASQGHPKTRAERVCFFSCVGDRLRRRKTAALAPECLPSPDQDLHGVLPALEQFERRRTHVAVVIPEGQGAAQAVSQRHLVGLGSAQQIYLVVALPDSLLDAGKQEEA